MSGFRTALRRLTGIELVICVSILVVLAGLTVPVLRSAHLKAEIEDARGEMELLRQALLQFMEDTGVGPTRSPDGDARGLLRLCGPGRIAALSYFAEDRHQGWLEDHLLRNEPGGPAAPGYASWSGPYLERLGPDPWGSAYIVNVYPLATKDERDCVIVSAGPDGSMNSSYASPLDPVAVGDDLILTVVDKSVTRDGPLY